MTQEQIQQFVLLGWNWAAIFLPRVLAAAATLVIGLFLAGWLARAASRLLMRTPHLDAALKPIIAAVVRYLIVILTAVATLEQLGFQTSSLLAILGAAGLAVGLALQGTLSNIAAGIMLLWLRPFEIGDFIEVAGQSGVVNEIGLFSCKLRTFDGLFLFLPNSTIWNAPLKNHTRNGGRLLAINVVFPTAVDLSRARNVLLEAARHTVGVLPDPPPRVFVEALTIAGVTLSLAVWSASHGAGAIERTLIEQIKHSSDPLGGDLKPIQITRTVPADTDPSRFLEINESANARDTSG